MDKEALKVELLLQCQNVQCGAKLCAEIHYVYKGYETEDVLFFEDIFKHFPELKYFINYHPDKEAKKNGWHSVYLYKYDNVNKLIDEINDIQDKDSALYHFANGKLFGYNDFEVIKFINNNYE